MNWEHDQWGAFLGFVVTLLFFGYLAWAFPRRRRRQSDCVADGPPDELYRIYTRKYDREVEARNVVDMLKNESPDVLRGWSLRNPEIWRAKIASAREIHQDHDNAVWSDALRVALVGKDNAEPDVAICLLIDHSGSMRGDPILHTAAAARWLSNCLCEIGAPFSLLGFSTVGWHGGKAYENWRSRGQPKRPGRLCALLHIKYASFDDPLSDDDWEAMMHPDILRENVDGEAILWACEHLRCRPEPHKLLVILSDGAPVDDKTLEYNGPSYLWRHIKAVIADVENSDDILIAAVGINQRVGDFYRRSRSVENLSDLPEAISSVIVEAVSQIGGARTPTSM